MKNQLQFQLQPTAPLSISSTSTFASTSNSLDFTSFFIQLNSHLLSSTPNNSPLFLSLTLSPTPKPQTLTLTSPPPSPSLPPLTRAAIGAAAGGLAGAATYAALLPLDAIKTHLQTHPATSSSGLSAAISILRLHGPLGFYRGLSAVVLGSASSSAVYFATCELAKSILYSHSHLLPRVFVPPLAGATGNIVSSAIMVPKELITQRLQSGVAHGRSWEVFARILRTDGVLGLYAGYTATLLRNLPAGVLSYSCFEYFKLFVLNKGKKASLEPAESVVCGALAGAISAALTTPLDVVKTRLMTRARVEGMSGTVLGTMREVVKEEGLVGLTRGIGPRVLHSACFAALGYCAFETARLAILRWYLLRREKEAAAVAS